MTSEFERDLGLFANWNVGTGRTTSEKTIDRRVRRIKHFTKIIDVYDPDLLKIHQYCRDELKRGKSQNTLRLEMQDLKHWCEYKGIDIELPRFKKRPNPPPFVPSDEQVKQILSYCERYPREVWLRNKVLYEIGAFCGLRVGEVTNLRMDDISLDDSTVYVRSEKGEQDRIVGIPDFVISDIRDYLKFRMPTDPRAFFTTKEGRMPYEYIRSLTAKIGHKLNMPKLHYHSLRHYYATLLLNLNRDLREIQLLLGHANVQTTVVYTHVQEMKMSKEVKNVIHKHFLENRDLNSNVREQSGAYPYQVGALGFEPRSTGLFRIIVPVTHH